MNEPTFKRSLEVTFGYGKKPTIAAESDERFVHWIDIPIAVKKMVDGFPVYEGKTLTISMTEFHELVEQVTKLATERWGEDVAKRRN